MKYVYLLKAGENHYKVGVALNITRRIKGIQTSNGNKIYIVATKLCRNANEVEKRIHKSLEKLATHGGREWFTMEPEDVLRVAILMNQEPEIDVFGNASLNDMIAQSTEQYRILNQKIDRLMTQPKSEIIDEIPGVVMPPDDNQLLEDAIMVIHQEQGASTSLLQRKLRIGYGRAARLMEELEGKGIVSAADGSRRRELLKTE